MNAVTDPRILSPGLYVSPEMITELAMGLDPTATIADKYGFDPVAFGALSQQGWFQEAVVRRRTELSEEGVTFQAKAAMVSEELMMEGFKLARAGLMKPDEVTNLLKVTSGLAGMQPKHTVQPGEAGARFMIQINMPGDAQGPGARPDLEAQKLQQAVAGPMVIDLKPTAVTSVNPDGTKTVSGFSTPGFSMAPPRPTTALTAAPVALNADLAGPPLPKDTP